MSTYSVEELARLWRHEQITAEQAIGHIIQHMQLLHEELPPFRRAAYQVTKVDERLQRVERMFDAMVRAIQKERERR